MGLNLLNLRMFNLRSKGTSWINHNESIKKLQKLDLIAHIIHLNEITLKINSSNRIIKSKTYEI